MKYFYINNAKFNYNLEFLNNSYKERWKSNLPLIEYCETIGITVPHYCYHKTLSISGNCRMCLVELKNSPKPVVSCALSAKACLNNGEVFTNSPLIKKARENILEFLLLNHPLDCPICDQGGECDLQDQSFFFGLSKKRFYSFKRFVTDKNIGPIVKTVMTRCIHCTRCVRFAKEISGVEELGVFGRGLSSEIGTYIDKIFASELSGNVIDLCPVGALTSKPYPFIGRNWELKSNFSIDASDSFGSNIELFLKNNKIIKIVGTTDPSISRFPWISDKTRFSFDGMFASTKILNPFIKTKTDEIRSVKWKTLFKHICSILYFHDHLSYHFAKQKLFVICFSSSISLEVLNLLIILAKKFSFIRLKRVDQSKINNDSELNFLTNFKKTVFSKLNHSNLCVLLGINTRYETFPLNLKLRQRFSKGNFKTILFGSSTDLTFPTSYGSFNLNLVRSLVEGNNAICQELLNAKSPIIFISSEITKRKDIKVLSKLLDVLKFQLQLYHNNWDNTFLLGNELNEAGLNYLSNFESISEKTVENTGILYCLNTSFETPVLKKLVELKLLNLVRNKTSLPGFIFYQNEGYVDNFQNLAQSALYVSNFLNIPNNSFFETTGTYLTTGSFFKKSMKVLVSNTQSKENWQILRKTFGYTAEVVSLYNNRINNKIFFNCKKFLNFQSYTLFQYYAVKNLTKFTSIQTKSFCDYNVSFDKYKIKRVNFFETKLRLWLDDFYIGGKDSYSKHSLVMINCSKINRLKSSNFKFI
uniref:Complex I-75kD n=1 Tax=Trieres regia TaxID=1335017 RepID=A0A7T5BNF0_9STRA|nr:NADH dehydrogenase subunit 11 [Odontella regia]QQD79322.1 NADH dehydrogenase subunit 11 [Odontella regia]